MAVALALGAWPSAASAQSAGSIWWQLPTQVAPSGEGFYAITCPSTSLCLVTATSVQAGSPSDVASSTDPTGGASAWRFDAVDRNTSPLPDGGTFPAYLKGITCPSVSLCVAVDDAGYVLTTRNPTAGAGAWTNTNISGSPSFTAVACASESLCVATAKRGPPADILAAVSTNPTGGAGAWRSEEIHSSDSDCAQGCINGGYTQGISCPSESFCAAVDYTGHILTSRDPANDPGPWRVAFSDPNVDGFYPAPIPTIGCPSTRLCLGFDTAGYFIRSTDPTADSPTWQMSSFFAPVARSYFTRDLSCAMPSLCMVPFPDAGSIVASDDPANPQTWTSAKIDPDASLTGIACPSAGLCIAVDTAAHAGGPAGRVIVGRAGPTRAQLRALLRSRLAPHGKASRIGALLKHRGLTLPLASPVPGLIHITWSYTPKHARSHGRALVADGTHTYPTPDRGTVRLALTRRARALLEHRRASLRLTAQATFTPFVGDPLTATRAIRLPR